MDMGNQPLANSFHNGVDLPVYPLQLTQCKKCNHHQLNYSVDPKLMFDDYLYISDTSKTLNDYFVWLKNYIGSPSSVLEVACNSGCFLSLFKQDVACKDVLGCDPAKNLKKLSSDRGLDVLDTYWNLETARGIGRKFDVVIAINVLPHVPDPVGFLVACKEACKGKIYVQTSHSDIFEKHGWDTFYHEHISYFTVSSFEALSKRVGLTITRIQKTPIHSESFLLELQEGGVQDPGLEVLKEEESRFNTMRFRDHIIRTKQQICDILRDRKFMAYGASAKGNTAMNYFGLQPAYVVDDSPMKWGYMTPGTNSLITSPNILSYEKDDIHILMTAWNFKDEITAKIRKIRPNNNDTLVYYTPHVHTASVHPLCG